MARLRKRRAGSMFRWYFVQTSVSVILCLTISSFAILFFFMTFWKNDELTALNDDALSVAQGVDSLFAEIAADEQMFSKDSVQNIINIVSTVALSSNTEVYISDNEGNILFCHDVELSEDIKENIKGTCVLHSHVRISSDIINGINNSSGQGYNYEGKLTGFENENYLLGSAKIMLNGAQLYVIVVQAESVAFIPYTTEYLRIMIFSSIIALLLSVILASFVSYRMVRPLKKITSAIKLYAGGDFSVRINTSDVYKELSQLVDSVNRMADSLAVIEESRSSFVANVSHELKTPMTIISGFIDGMLDGTIPEEDSQKYLSIVSDEVKRLSRLVVAMLNMSKIEAGKLTLNLTSFSLSDIFIKTIMGFEKYIENKDITVSGLDTLENSVILADETLITQIIYNLVDNAVKFTPHGGEITFSLYEEKKEAVFSVRNTGKGISQEEIGLVFDRFYKVDKSRGLDAKSFGLGLYIVKSIIELHNGTININSDEESYTEFEVRLPLQK